jgi:hypothetical protein
MKETKTINVGIAVDEPRAFAARLRGSSAARGGEW